MTPAAKKKNRNVNIPIMESACKKNSVRIKVFSPYSFRLIKEDWWVIDFYPSTARAFFHEQNEWVDVENVAQFFKFHFDENYRKSLGL